MKCAAMTLLLVPLSILAATPAFEVASVKVTKDRAPRFGSITHGPDTLTMRGISLWMAVRWAYGIESFQLSAPEWTQTDPIYDVLGKAPAQVPASQMRLMLGTLLSERFHLAVHWQKQQMSVSALLVAKSGKKFHETTEKYNDALGPEMPFQFLGFDGSVHMQRRLGDGGRMTDSFTNISMPVFASVLAMFASRNPFEKVPVLDMTGLKGKYDVIVVHDRLATTEGEHPTGDDVLADYKTLLQKQLGLTLEPRKAAVEVLVVDHVDRQPTPN
jgi:uncharacterized protein (TIGR03435 family)